MVGGASECHGAFSKAAERLRRVTGFVTVFWRAPDFRPLAFSRYYHVRRVAWLAQHIASRRQAAGEALDTDTIAWLSWGHDINRWPFAHNSEKGLFDQAGDIPRYFADVGIEASPRRLLELQHIINKKPHQLSEEARIVLLADIVAGFVEDPLWAIAALDLHPRIIPDDIAQYLGLPVHDGLFIRRLHDLNTLFYETKTVDPFKVGFDALFKEIAAAFLERQDLELATPFRRKSFESARSRIKDEFMRGRLFPYNNGHVSMGAKLKADIVTPVLSRMGGGANRIMTSLDDGQLIDLAVEYGFISAEESQAYIPRLDYVGESEPENSFRAQYEGRHHG